MHDEAELRQLLKAHGWFLRSKTSGGKKRYARYYYAERRRGLKKVSRYLCPVEKLENISAEVIVEKLSE